MPEYDNESSEEEYIEPKPSKKPVQKKNIKQSNKTPIEELADETDEEDHTPTSRPRVGIVTGPNSYDMTDFSESQESNRDVSRHMKNSTAPATGKGNNLMAAAMAMQKERDKVDSNKPKGIGEFVTTKRPL